MAWLPADLAPRTTDSNKNLAVQVLKTICDLVLAMGPHTRPNIPALPCPALIVTDKKKLRLAPQVTSAHFQEF